MLDFGMGAFNLSYHFAFLTSVRLIIISPFFDKKKALDGTEGCWPFQRCAPCCLRLLSLQVTQNHGVPQKGTGQPVAEGPPLYIQLFQKDLKCTE